MPGGEPPATLSYTLGGTCKKNLPPLYTETTNQHYFETLPTQKREEQPEHFQTDKRFAHTATINRELKSAQDPPAENVNRRRGELTRNPREHLDTCLDRDGLHSALRIAESGASAFQRGSPRLEEPRPMWIKPSLEIM
eukprot:scaffold168954_cov18-Tisochrysis_lutea.AAC.1